MSHNDMTTAQKNLTQAAEIETSSAWSVARLIAASVEVARGKRTDVAPQGAKLAIKEAARVMGRSDNTIRAYLNAWNAAAADGLCAPSSDLTPDDGWTADMPDAADWEKYKQGNSHSAPRKVETVPAEPVNATEQWTREQKIAVAQKLVADDPEVAGLARSAANTYHPEPPRVSDEMKARIARGEEVREANEKSMTEVQKSIAMIGLSRASREISKVRKEAAGTRFSEQERGAIAESIEDVRLELIGLEQVVQGVDWDAELAKLSGGAR